MAFIFGSIRANNIPTGKLGLKWTPDFLLKIEYNIKMPSFGKLFDRISITRIRYLIPSMSFSNLLSAIHLLLLLLHPKLIFFSMRKRSSTCQPVVLPDVYWHVISVSWLSIAGMLEL